MTITIISGCSPVVGVIIVVLGRLPLGRALWLPVHSLVRLHCQRWPQCAQIHGHRVLRCRHNHSIPGPSCWATCSSHSSPGNVVMSCSFHTVTALNKDLTHYTPEIRTFCCPLVVGTLADASSTDNESQHRLSATSPDDLRLSWANLEVVAAPCSSVWHSWGT